MPTPRVTVVVPTLVADSTLADCLTSLAQQTFREFTVVIVDNSGQQLVRRRGMAGEQIAVIENRVNAGFGAAINQAIRETQSDYVASLNDDAAAHTDWLRALVEAMESRDEIGMCASQVRLAEGGLDSAGMVICADGSTKQRGHGVDPAAYPEAEEVLFPSGSAALYRRAMLDQIGLFDESFFLYCEDSDLGLRARRAGWKCLYVPGAVADHRYSHSAGRASPIKAYYVERNRLYLVAKNFPAIMMAASPFVALVRYFWHAVYLFTGRGTAGRYRAEGNTGFKLPWYLLRAHLAMLGAWPRLMRTRRAIRLTGKISDREFATLLRAHRISPRQVAAQ